MASTSTDDIIERAEQYLKVFDDQPERYIGARGMIRELLAALKAARAARCNASELDESVIAHVLADIDQVSAESQWSLRERLEVIQKICDGSEYVQG